MFRFSKWILLSALCVVSICRGGDQSPAGHAPDWTKLLDRTEKVEAVLLNYNIEKNSIIERTKRKGVDKARTKKIKTLLKTDRNWEQVGLQCEPDYGARLVFYLAPSVRPAAGGAKIQPSQLTVDLCFQCSMVQVGQDGNGLGNSNDNFKPMRPDLLKHFRELFPQDAKLSAVK